MCGDGAGWLFAWPKTLRGSSTAPPEVSVVVHRPARRSSDDEVTFGAGRGRIEVVNRNGQPLSLDKYLTPVRDLRHPQPEHVEPLLDAIDEVLAALRTAGVEPFLAYGTLLGAVREGRLLGHDSDADLGYVSRHTTRST